MNPFRRQSKEWHNDAATIIASKLNLKPNEVRALAKGWGAILVVVFVFVLIGLLWGVVAALWSLAILAWGFCAAIIIFLISTLILHIFK